MQVYSIVNPETEEAAAMEGGEGQEALVDELGNPIEAPPPEPPKPTTEELIAAKEAEWQAQSSALQTRLAQVQPFIEQAQRAQAAQANAQLEAIVQRVVETSENSEEPLEESEISALRTYVQKAAAMDQWSPWIAQNQVAASALIYAGAHLGRDATVGELQDLAKELAAYRDPRLMQARISMLKGAQASQTQAQRQQVAAARSVSGVDRVTPAPTQSADASDFTTLERKVAENKATPAEWSRYEKLYSIRRRG